MIQEVKVCKAKLYMFISLFCLLMSCAGKQPVPVGCWRSDNQRPDIVITKADSGGYAAIVFHRLHDGVTCPIAYPVVQSATGMYIHAEGKILLSYDEEKDRLFLSPGGTYRRKCVDRNISRAHYHCNFVSY